jgi:hypothetical protein
MRLIFVLRLHGWIAALDNGRGRLLKCSSRIDSLREEGYRLKRKGGERPARGRSTPARVRTELKWTAASLEIAGGATDADMGTTNIVAPPWFKTWLDTPGRAFREAKAASSTKSVACRSSEVEMTGKSRNATHTSKPTLRMVTQRSWRCAHEFRTHWHRGSAKIRPHKRLSASSTAQILTPAFQARYVTITSSRFEFRPGLPKNSSQLRKLENRLLGPTNRHHAGFRDTCKQTILQLEPHCLAFAHSLYGLLPGRWSAKRKLCGYWRNIAISSPATATQPIYGSSSKPPSSHRRNLAAQPRQSTVAVVPPRMTGARVYRIGCNRVLQSVHPLITVKSLRAPAPQSAPYPGNDQMGAFYLRAPLCSMRRRTGR